VSRRIHRSIRPCALTGSAIAVAVLLVGAPHRAHAQTASSEGNPQVPAELVGHALLPALSLVPPPQGAPRDFAMSGKFIDGARNEVPMSRPGDTGGLHGRRPTGLSLPFVGQPVQGFSGFAMNEDEDGRLIAMIDNGFGSKLNSTDALLRFVRVAPDWDEGTIAIDPDAVLHDPDGVIPHRLVQEGTFRRFLTGGDLDPESIQVIGDTVWIGDEFGPWLLSATLDGRITGIVETEVDGEIVKSADHPTVRAPAEPGVDFRVPRSGGFEGLAMTPDGERLWAMLEKPLLGEEGDAEGAFLRVLEFDPAAGEWTGESFRYALDKGATAIGDFNFIDDTRALVIERDNGEGDPSLACADAESPTPDCFPHPARFKRVVLIDTADLDEQGVARKLAHIDLMDIDDPNGAARLETDTAAPTEGRFTFPFFTIESVRAVDDEHIVVAMDNNLPFSSGRQLDAAADNEFVLLRVPELLAAR